MPGLPFVGKNITDDADVVYDDYVQIVKDQDLSEAEVTAAVTSGLSGFVDKSVVDAADDLNATQAYINDLDNLRVKLADKNVYNSGRGVAGLDATGKILPGLISVPSAQTFHVGPLSPATYHSSTNVGAETTLFTLSVPDPGFAHRILVFGAVDVGANFDGIWPILNVRADNATTGPIIASGAGLSDSYFQGATYGDTFDGASLDAAKWGTIAATGYSNISLDTTNHWVRTVNGSRQMSQWIGQQPSQDSVRITFNLRDISFGELRIFFCAQDDWRRYLILELEKVSPVGARATFYTATNLLPSQTGVTQRDTANVGAVDGEWNTGQQQLLEYDATTKEFFYRNSGSKRLSWTDSTNIVGGRGSGNRRIGVMTNSGSGVGSFTGMGLDNFLVTEPTSNPATSQVKIIPADQASRTGATTLYVTARRSSGTTETVAATAFNPRLYVMVVP